VEGSELVENEVRAPDMAAHDSADGVRHRAGAALLCLSVPGEQAPLSEQACVIAGKVVLPRREELDDQERVLLESIVEVLSRQLEDLLR
jgi:hypothetical protein